ncbi:hypothetical protein HK13_06930 [Acetobacter indonesiensis]|uniref:ABC transporter domain-containing protein n=2 Tax=Acetobacter TaxID=434 RepID=A0A252AKW4_9PROT|nr:hypothetical protein HK17_13955 [Acetobacter indonesiensis]OUI94002.1 hypothetical protein HK13_06930 [Acetobacter indonesiensis]
MSSVPECGFASVLAVERLSVSVAAEGQQTVIVNDVSFRVAKGEMLAVVGESGSGKSTLVKTILGLLPRHFKWGGSVQLCGQALEGFTGRQLKQIRGKRIGFVPQDPATSLDPLQPVGAQLNEILAVHTGLSRQERELKIQQLFTQVGLKEPQKVTHCYPHELSGGMQQRVLIAMALALTPDILIADEATSALDASVQQQIMALLGELQQQGIAILFVTHDLPLAARYATTVMVLKSGEVQETGPAQVTLQKPQSAYGQKLIQNTPSFWRPVHHEKTITDPTQVVVEVKDLSFSYAGQQEPVLSQLNFCVGRGTTHAVIGESGAGKSTLLKLLQGRLQATAGAIMVDGINPAELTGQSRQEYGRVMQMVYQQPSVTFDPLLSVKTILEEPLVNYRKLKSAQRLSEIHDVLNAVHLPLSILKRKTADISGGQAQRLALARALLCRPEIMIMDEIVSALDVNVQSEILTLIMILQKKFGITYIFVSHDLAVVRQIADTVTILKKGCVVQTGVLDDVFFENPSEYTKQLIACVNY